MTSQYRSFLTFFICPITLVSTHHLSLFLMIHISRMECQFHELTYMKASLELMDVKEEIDHLIRERHVLDQKIEAKNREQNELTEKCMRHIRVLKRKGMTGDFYCPKKRGVMATPTKTGGSSYAPNYTPSLQMGTPPQAQMGNTSSQGGLWSPINTGQLAQTATGCSPSRFTSFHHTGGLLQHYPPGNKCQQMSPSYHIPTSTPQKPNQSSSGAAVMIVKKKPPRSPYDAGLTDDDLLGYADEVDNYSQAASGRESDNDSGKEGCGSGGKIQGACNTEHSKDVTHDSDKQVKESTLDNGPDSVRRQILQDKQ